ncbi:hypothetical protein DSCW_32730 [Desulfosarcina widdelii]|uniref:DUF2213 domain-containing protein n=1 Tax=Desulfosarcina widdelii TaxID=947919 RepID=A0A5K7Z2E6_9BACT|nr:DUF2213 domain-containing protein [Desulfosarcina widdelii]BBO75856.1 hypothetical protein DSCW_32730 [Desulfosarcina widdelii]
MKIAFANKAERPHWEKTPDGFLRCRARVLAERIMPYDRSELDDPPPGQGLFNMLVTKNEMASSAALRSLEGIPIVAGDHTWLTPELVKNYSVGSVAGTPKLDGDYLVCDLLVTDPETIRAIEAEELPEISAAYMAETIFEPGVFNNATYDALQTELRFNHVALIAEGRGRAGRDVRILNTKGAMKMSHSQHFENGRKKALAAIESKLAAARKDAEGSASLKLVNTRQRSPQERLGFAPTSGAESRRFENAGEAQTQVQRVFARTGSRKCMDPLAESRRITRLMNDSAIERAALAETVAHNRRAHLRRLGFTNQPSGNAAPRHEDLLFLVPQKQQK